MQKVKQIGTDLKAKAADHPNADSNPNINPDSGSGIGANQGHDAGNSDLQNRIQAGQGSEDPEDTIKAGSTTSGHTASAAEAGGVTKSSS